MEIPSMNTSCPSLLRLHFYYMPKEIIFCLKEYYGKNIYYDNLIVSDKSKIRALKHWKENNKPETIAYFHYLTYPLIGGQNWYRLNLSRLMWSQTCFHYDHEIPIRQEEIPYECYAMCNFSYIRDETLFYRKKTYFQTRNHFKFIELYSDVFIF